MPDYFSIELYRLIPYCGCDPFRITGLFSILFGVLESIDSSELTAFNFSPSCSSFYR